MNSIQDTIDRLKNILDYLRDEIKQLFLQLPKHYNNAIDYIVEKITSQKEGEVIIIILAIIGLIIAWRARKVTWLSYLLSKSQIKQPANIELSMYIPNCKRDIFMIFPFKKERVILLPFIILLDNIGESAAYDIELYFTLSDILYVKSVGRNMSKIAEDQKYIHLPDTPNSEHLITVYCKFPYLRPQGRIHATDFIRIAETTILPVNCETFTNDGFKTKFVVTVYTAFTLKVVATWKDGGHVIKEYKLHIRNGVLRTLKRFIKSEEKSHRKGDGAPFDFTIVSVSCSDVGSVLYEGKSDEGVVRHLLQVDQKELRFMHGKFQDDNIHLEKFIIKPDYKSDIEI